MVCDLRVSPHTHTRTHTHTHSALANPPLMSTNKLNCITLPLPPAALNRTLSQRVQLSDASTRPIVKVPQEHAPSITPQTRDCERARPRKASMRSGDMDHMTQLNSALVHRTATSQGCVHERSGVISRSQTSSTRTVAVTFLLLVTPIQTFCAIFGEPCSLPTYIDDSRESDRFARNAPARSQKAAITYDEAGHTRCRPSHLLCREDMHASSYSS